jgi:hypothetical protein
VEAREAQIEPAAGEKILVRTRLTPLSKSSFRLFPSVSVCFAFHSLLEPARAAVAIPGKGFAIRGVNSFDETKQTETDGNKRRKR